MQVILRLSPQCVETSHTHSRVAMRAEIKSLHERSKTTAIYVTHDQVEAMTMVNRIVVMNEGRIERISPPLWNCTINL